MVSKIVSNAVESNNILVIPNDDGKSCNIGGVDVRNNDIFMFLLSLAVSMHESTGINYNLDIDETLIHEIKNDDIRDVRSCSFIEVRVH